MCPALGANNKPTSCVFGFSVSLPPPVARAGAVRRPCAFRLLQTQRPRPPAGMATAVCMDTAKIFGAGREAGVPPLLSRRFPWGCSWAGGEHWRALWTFSSVPGNREGFQRAGGTHLCWAAVCQPEVPPGDYREPWPAALVASLGQALAGARSPEGLGSLMVSQRAGSPRLGAERVRNHGSFPWASVAVRCSSPWLSPPLRRAAQK